jgi:hypothetical protein
MAEQQRLGDFVCGSQQDQEAVSAIGKRMVVVLPADSGLAQSLPDEPVNPVA